MTQKIITEDIAYSVDPDKDPPSVRPNFETVSALPAHDPEIEKHIFFGPVTSQFSISIKFRDMLDNANITPVQAYQILVRDLPGDIRSGQSGMPVIDLRLQDKIHIQAHQDNQKLFGDSRKFLDAETVGSGNMVVNFGQGNGTGRRLMRNEIELFTLMGFKKFEIQASMGNGAYSWARLGFLPKNDISRDALSLQLKHRISMLREFNIINNVQADELRTLADLDAPEDIRNIANLRENLFTRLDPVFRQNTATLTEDWFVGNEQGVTHIIASLNQAGQSGGYFPLARALLTAASWAGELDLTNRSELGHVAEYTGGFKYLDLTV